MCMCINPIQSFVRVDPTDEISRPSNVPLLKTQRSHGIVDPNDQRLTPMVFLIWTIICFNVRNLRPKIIPKSSPFLWGGVCLRQGVSVCPECNASRLDERPKPWYFLYKMAVSTCLDMVLGEIEKGSAI